MNRINTNKQAGTLAIFLFCNRPHHVTVVLVVVVEVAITKVHVPAVVLTVLTATPVPACGYCVYYLILN